MSEANTNDVIDDASASSLSTIDNDITNNNNETNNKKEEDNQDEHDDDDAVYVTDLETIAEVDEEKENGEEKQNAVRRTSIGDGIRPSSPTTTTTTSRNKSSNHMTTSWSSSSSDTSDDTGAGKSKKVDGKIIAINKRDKTNKSNISSSSSSSSSPTTATQSSCNNNNHKLMPGTWEDWEEDSKNALGRSHYRTIDELQHDGRLPGKTKKGEFYDDSLHNLSSTSSGEGESSSSSSDSDGNNKNSKGKYYKVATKKKMIVPSSSLSSPDNSSHSRRRQQEKSYLHGPSVKSPSFSNDEDESSDISNPSDYLEKKKKNGTIPYSSKDKIRNQKSLVRISFPSKKQASIGCSKDRDHHRGFCQITRQRQLLVASCIVFMISLTTLTVVSIILPEQTHHFFMNIESKILGPSSSSSSQSSSEEETGEKDEVTNLRQLDDESSLPIKRKQLLRSSRAIKRIKAGGKSDTPQQQGALIMNILSYFSATSTEKNYFQSETENLPKSYHFLMPIDNSDNSDETRPSLPIFWYASPLFLSNSQSTTVQIMTYCFNLILTTNGSDGSTASSTTAPAGVANPSNINSDKTLFQNEVSPLMIYTASDNIGHYLNVDMTTKEGIQRAKDMNFNLENALIRNFQDNIVVVSPLLHDTITSLFDESSNSHGANTHDNSHYLTSLGIGKVFTMLQHPVLSIIEQYRIYQDLCNGATDVLSAGKALISDAALEELCKMPLNQYVESHYVSENMLVKTLANLMPAEETSRSSFLNSKNNKIQVTVDDINTAKHMLEAYFVVGIDDQYYFDESIKRFRHYFNWPMPEEKQRQNNDNSNRVDDISTCQSNLLDRHSNNLDKTSFFLTLHDKNSHDITVSYEYKTLYERNWADVELYNYAINVIFPKQEDLIYRRHRH